MFPSSAEESLVSALRCLGYQVRCNRRPTGQGRQSSVRIVAESTTRPASYRLAAVGDRWYDPLAHRIGKGAVALAMHVEDLGLAAARAALAKPSATP